MITRADVAKRAGVSVSAVSRTMNSKGYVAKEKKEMILRVVEELGYRPNPLSNSLKNRQTYQLCFFGYDTYNSFYSEIFDHMSAVAMEKGYTLFHFSTFNIDRVKHMLMDGMVVQNEQVAAGIQELLGVDFFMPIVSASYGAPVIQTKGIPYVDVDAYDATSLGLAYLKEQGHDKIAFATPYSFHSDICQHPRHICFHNTMKAAYGSDFGCYIVDNPRASEPKRFEREMFYEQGMSGADTFIVKQSDATAILCFNDEYAMGMIRRFTQLGRRIPEDISIMGIDGLDKRKYASPLPTSVSMNMDEQAKRCIDTLVDMIEGRRVKFFTSVKPYIAAGDSVKKRMMR